MKRLLFLIAIPTLVLASACAKSSAGTTSGDSSPAPDAAW